MSFRSIMQATALAFALFLAATSVLAAPLSYQLQVDGLACPFCAYGIEKKLTALEGVERVETNINAGVVIVTMQGDFVLDEATAKAAVASAGFSLRKLEQVQPTASDSEEGTQ